MSAMKIHGNEYTINKVFSDDFAFEIPHYQRPYRWTTEQAGELLDDLLGTLRAHPDKPVDDLPPYFLGCVVLIKQESVPDPKVVDGQQRLTTLTSCCPPCGRRCVNAGREVQRGEGSVPATAAAGRGG